MDKRKASWILTDEALESISECFKTEAALFNELGTNTKTGKKILNQEAVKRDILKESVYSFLEFLKQINGGGRNIDASRHHEEDVRNAIKLYIVEDMPVYWGSLAKELDQKIADKADRASA